MTVLLSGDSGDAHVSLKFHVHHDSLNQKRLGNLILFLYRANANKIA